MSDHARVWKQNLRNPIISYHVISYVNTYIYILILRIFTIITSGQILPATSGQVAWFQSNDVVQVSTKGLRMSLFDTWTTGPMDQWINMVCILEILVPQGSSAKV